MDTQMMLFKRFLLIPLGIFDQILSDGRSKTLIQASSYGEDT